jgi:hypothetical protein
MNSFNSLGTVKVPAYLLPRNIAPRVIYLYENEQWELRGDNFSSLILFRPMFTPLCL